MSGNNDSEIEARREAYKTLIRNRQKRQEDRAPRPIQGPQPNEHNTRYHGLVDSKDYANIGAELRPALTQHDASPRYVSEAGVYRTLQTATAYALAVPPKHRETMENEVDILTYALADIQAEKLRKGMVLEAPFTPHPDVPMPNPDAPEFNP